MVKAKKKLSLAEKKEAAQGYLFVTPYLIAFTIFTGIPFVSAFVLSFMNVKFITKLDSAKFVGLKNFIRPVQRWFSCPLSLRSSCARNTLWRASPQVP